MQKCCKSMFLLERFGIWPFMVRCSKRLQNRIFLDNGHFALKGFQFSNSGQVLVFWFHGGGGETLFPGANGSQSFLLCVCFPCITYSFCLLSLKRNSISVRKRIRPIWVRSALTLLHQWGKNYPKLLQQRTQPGGFLSWKSKTSVFLILLPATYCWG